MLDVIDGILGLSLKAEEIGIVNMTARAALIYVALIAIVRSGKKRALGGATVFDVILAVILGSIAARAITGGAQFFPAMLSLALLVFLHWLLSAAARDNMLVSRLIQGRALCS